MFNKVRKSVQYISLLLVVLIPFLGYLNSLRQEYGKSGFHVARMMGGRLEGALYSIYEWTLGRLDDPIALIDTLKGTYWSITLFGLQISDPVAGLGYILATKQIYVPFLISILIPVLATIIFGRAFCGWICPVNTLAEMIDKARGWIQTNLLPRTMDINLGRATKYGVLLGGMILIAVTGAHFFALSLPYLALGREFHNFFYFSEVDAGVYFLVMLALFEVLVSRRGWCRYLCPSGAMLSLMSSYSMVKLVKDERSACIYICQDCDDVCQMGLSVRNGEPGIECSMCADCVSVCPQGALELTFSPSARSVGAVIIFTLLLLFFAAPADAHHIAGLPHYGYTENYPQSPLTEREQEVGEYTVSLTSVFFQGIKQELSYIPYDTQFFVYIYKKRALDDADVKGFQNPFDADNKKNKTKNKANNGSYRGKLHLAILDQTGQKVATYALGAPSEESVYRFRHYFVRPGKYKVKLAFFPNGGRRVAVFSVSVGVGGGFPLPVIFGVAVIAGLGALLYYRKKKAPLVLSG